MSASWGDSRHRELQSVDFYVGNEHSSPTVEDGAYTIPEDFPGSWDGDTEYISESGNGQAKRMRYYADNIRVATIVEHWQ